MANPTRQMHLMSTDTMDSVAVALAQRSAMERGGKMLPHGCRLYKIDQGRESAMLLRDPAIRRCDTLSMLEAALRDPEVRTVFIPARALMTDRDVERVCQRNGVTKTLFREEEGA